MLSCPRCPYEIQDAFGNATSLGYDARSLERKVTDAEGFETLYTYDGLNRRTFEQMPEGITITREYDKSSRLLAYVDALSNRTSWTYDALDRTTSMTYPDATAETYEHDAANNLVRRVDQRGTEIVQSFDLANRLTGRTATPTAGEIVEGPFTESYVYDGLDRLLQGQSGTVVTDFTYDSLSRRVSETTLGRTVTYDYDEVSNPVRLGYPSGVVIGQQFDALDRPSRIGPMAAGEIVDRASYGYRGPHLLQEKRSGAGLSKTWQYDAARCPVRAHTASPAVDAYPIFDERLSWSPRGLKVATYRQDLGGVGFELSQDGAHRLKHAAVKISPAGGPPNNSVHLGLDQAPDRFSFAYDAAQNLISRQKMSSGAASSTALPPDASGRNRPGAIGGTTLEYDANGNLKRKGALRFYYDFRDRLSRVTDDQGIEVATYEYDVFNRRVKAHQPAAGANPAQTTETVWSGWRELEQYRDGVLHQRFTRGVGIDEIVRIEADQDLNGQLDADLVPHYDETGNVALLTGANDEIVARYEASPFGETITARVDSLPPEVEQVRVTTEVIEIEISEEHLLPEEIAGRIELSLVNGPSAGAPIAIEVSQPVQEGRMARHRLAIRPTAAPNAGEQVQLTLEPDAVRDLFLNPMSAIFQTTVTWPASGSEVVSDTADPEVEELRLQDGHLELIFSEPPDLASASSAVQVDGASLSWNLEPDGYTLRSVDPLAVGAHTVTIAAGAALDRAGKGLGEAFSESISVTSGVQNEEYFAKPDPREVGMEALVNRFAFHGRPVDLETGLVYFRNRYYDPEMGRFVTADPLGFVDGPSMYGFAGYSPGDVTDPMGLYIIAGPRELYEIRKILKDLDLTDLAQSLMLTKRNGETVIGIYSGMAHRQWQDLASSLGLTKEEDGDYVFTNEDDVDSVAAMIGGVILSKFRTEVHVLDGHQVCLGQFSFWLGGYCHFGRDLIKTSGGVTKMEESGGRYRATVAVNTYLTSLVRPLGSEGTRIPMTPRAALVHELGHVWATIEKEIKSSELNLSTSGPTDVEAVIFEDHYRIKVGLPLRGSHSPATFCTGEEEIRGLSPKNCQDRLRQDFSR